MLRIYSTAIEIIETLRPVFEQIARHDPKLADQGRRASKSVVLQMAEGSYGRGNNRASKYSGAAGEMMETIAVLDVARADGLIEPVDPVVIEKMRKVVATLYKNVR
jgi:four helix bundle protein